MFKQAFQSYLASLHPRNLRKAYDEGKLFWILYWLIIYPNLMRFATGESEIYEVVYLLMIRLIPWGLMAWSSIGSKFLMTKMMFLTPIKEEERNEYIRCALFIKIGVSVLCSVFIEIICGIFYGMSLLRIIVLAIMNLSLGIATYISLDVMGKMDEKIYDIIKDRLSNTKVRWVNTLAIFLASVALAFVSVIDIGAEANLELFGKIYVGITIIFLIVLDIIIVRSQFKATIALAGNYELAFRILGKVEKPVKFDMFEKKK